MDFVPRKLMRVCQSDLKSFPVLTVTGPRQSGKSTLLRHLLPKWAYANLEDSETLEFATKDPKGFLKSHSQSLIIDEIQRAPVLLSQIQVNVDEDRRPGRYVLSGSHNLLLLEGISQSLAGRTSVRNLLPFSQEELSDYSIAPKILEETLYLGGYSPVHEFAKGAMAWLDSYLQTYVERDVRMIRNVSDIHTFRRFLKLCAGRCSQLVDLSSLGGDCGITHNTARDWLGVLEAGFITFRLPPYFRNFSKRLIKSPKLYFYDTGLLCRLLGITSSKDLYNHPFRGAIFENWCVLESIKHRINSGNPADLYFWRDQRMEVDLLIPKSAKEVIALDCKSSMTAASDFLKTPIKLASLATDITILPGVIYGGESTQKRTQGSIYSWKTFIQDLAL